MNGIEIPKDFKDLKLEEELKRFNLLELFKFDLSISEILLLNEILINYMSYTDIQTDDGTYKIFNYDSFSQRYSKYFKVTNVVYKAKDRLEKRGLIKARKGHFNCPQLGYCKIAIKINNKDINKILW